MFFLKKNSQLDSWIFCFQPSTVPSNSWQNSPSWRPTSDVSGDSYCSDSLPRASHSKTQNKDPTPHFPPNLHWTSLYNPSPKKVSSLGRGYIHPSLVLISPSQKVVPEHWGAQWDPPEWYRHQARRTSLRRRACGMPKTPLLGWKLQDQLTWRWLGKIPQFFNREYHFPASHVSLPKGKWTNLLVCGLLVQLFFCFNFFLLETKTLVVPILWWRSLGDFFHEHWDRKLD